MVRGLMCWVLVLVASLCAVCSSKGAEAVSAQALVQKWAKAPEMRNALAVANAKAAGFNEAIRAVQVQVELFRRELDAQLLALARELESRAAAQAKAKAKAAAKAKAEVAEKAKEPVAMPAPEKVR